MLNVRYSTRFKKDFKSCVKRGYKMALLQQAIDTLRCRQRTGTITWAAITLDIGNAT